MAYFPDGAAYSYCQSSSPAVNVGWLSKEHSFETETPSERLLDDLWSFCRFSVHQTRGLHECEFCGAPGEAPLQLPDGKWKRASIAWHRLQSEAWCVEHKGQKLYLGSSEIRVISRTGVIYASPTLIFHYVSTHRYKPPERFREALATGLRPGSEDYLAILKQIDPEWGMTHDWEERSLPLFPDD
jgi:hypothetical protein